MNSAIAASVSLQKAEERPNAAPMSEGDAALGRSLLLIPLLAAAAWAPVLGLIWLVWRLVS